MTHPVVAIDLGGTNIRAALVEADGTIIKRQRRPTPRQDATPSGLVEMVRDMAEGAACDRAVIGLPGVVDHEKETLISAPNLVQAWVPLLSDAWLTRETGLSVSLANDADLAAVGEATFGAGSDVRDVVYVTISTGIGAGIMLDRKLLRGRYSGGEIGHTIVDRTRALAGEDGTVEGLGSGTAIGANARRAGLDASGAELTELVRQGDPQAVPVFEESIRTAALGIVNLCWLVSPQTVVIGGGVGMNGDLVLPIVQDLVERFGPAIEPIKVVNAALGDDAGLVGAAAWWEAVGRSG